MIAYNRKLTVIMYHYVRDAHASRFPHLAALGVAAFREQVALVRQRYEMATFEAAIEFLAGRYQPARDLCLLTFDDGLKDHYQNVFPILTKARIQGLFFITTACQEGWVAAVHKSHFLMAGLGIDRYRESLLQQIALHSPATETRVTLADARRVYRWDSDDVATFKYLLNFRLDRQLRDRVLDELFRQHLGDEREFARELYLSWDEARQMQEQGMLMGGHSHRHLPLATLDAGQQRDDLATCARLLHAHLRPQQHWPFSYPYGKADSFDAQTINIAHELGFAGSFATEVGTNEAGQDPFRIRRVDTKDITVA
jgi:peptidoglycan/xylan/chitin deacetylase (PgdA/CDA1 family)